MCIYDYEVCILKINAINTANQSSGSFANISKVCNMFLLIYFYFLDVQLRNNCELQMARAPRVGPL